MVFAFVRDFYYLTSLITHTVAKMLLGAFLIGLLPTKYIAKIVGFSVGVLFWHGIPVVLAMPRR